MARPRTRTSHLLRIAVALCSACGAVADEPSNSGRTVDQIFAAWAARHERVHSGRFKMTEKRVLLPASQPGRKNRTRDDNGNKFPAEPLTLMREHEIVFDGIRGRHDRHGEDWSSRAEGPLPEHQVLLTDGEKDICYYGFQERTELEVHPKAHILSATGDRAGVFVGQGLVELPIFITFRAAHPGFSRSTGPGPYDDSRYRLLDREGTINGRRCLILDDLRGAEARQPHRIWVDPERDYIVLRNEAGVRDLVLFQLDIEYETDASGLWIPMHWTYLLHGEQVDGGGRVLQETAELTVTAYELNPSIDDAVFEFEIPPGTFILDFRDDKPKTFLTREGDVRPVTEDELLRGARFIDLIETDSGEALLPTQQASWRWTWLALATSLAAFGWLIWRRR